MIDQISLNVKVFVLVELLNVYHEHILFRLTVRQNVLLGPLMHFNFFKEFKFPHK